MLIVSPGSTSKIVEVGIRSEFTGQLLSGLVAGGMTIKYLRQGAAASVVVAPIVMVQGTWVSGGWIETDTAGIYQFGIPNAALITGVNLVTIKFLATNALDKICLVSLTDIYKSPAGSGTITFTYTLTNALTGDPIANALVWVTTDIGGSNIIANIYTDNFGVAIFYLDAGTYYFWRRKAGYDFTNPDTEVVST